MSDSAHDRWSDELAAYALDALGPEEAGAVEAHLAECERCRTELRWLEPAVDLLAESVPQVSPPPALRERLLSETAPRPEAENGRTGWGRFWPGWATRPVTALAVTALLVAGIAGYALRGGDDPAAPPAPQMALDRQGDSGTLRVSNLPPVGDDGVYQVWIQHGDEVSPSSAFVTGADGSAEARIPSDLEGADAVMVTYEQERGREYPSGEALIQTELD